VSLSMVYVLHHSSCQHSHTEDDHQNLDYSELAYEGITYILSCASYKTWSLD
jgi:hypothetical protein